MFSHHFGKSRQSAKPKTKSQLVAFLNFCGISAPAGPVLKSPHVKLERTAHLYVIVTLDRYSRHNFKSTDKAK